MAAMQAAAADLGVVAATAGSCPSRCSRCRVSHGQRARVAAAGVARGVAGAARRDGRRSRDGSHDHGAWVKALDAGGTFARIVRPIGPDETPATSSGSRRPPARGCCVDVLEAIERGTAAETPQDEAHAPYAPRLTKDDGRLDCLFLPQLPRIGGGLSRAHGYALARRASPDVCGSAGASWRGQPPPPAPSSRPAGGHLVWPPERHRRRGARAAAGGQARWPRATSSRATRLPAGACFDADRRPYDRAARRAVVPRAPGGLRRRLTCPPAGARPDDLADDRDARSRPRSRQGRSGGRRRWMALLGADRPLADLDRGFSTSCA